MSFRADFWTVAIVALGLLAVETGLRLADEWLSGDVAHLRDVPGIAQDLAVHPGLSVLMVGNSLLADGVDEQELARALGEELDLDAKVGKVAPDGTSPLEWSYLLRKTVLSGEEVPEVIVLAIGRGHLWDHPAEPEALRLALHYVAWADVGRLFDEHLSDIESRSQFLLARMTRAFALRDRIQPRILDVVLPHYRSVQRELLAVTTPNELGFESRTVTDLEDLRTLIQEAQQRGILVVMVQMPAPTAWEAEEAVRQLAGELSVPVVNVQNQASLAADRFPDGQHLDPAGMGRFTEVLGPRLAAEIGRRLD